MTPFRVVRSSYRMTVSYEDGPGSLTNPEQVLSAKHVVLTGQCKDPSLLTAEALSFHISRFPTCDYEDFGPAVGDHDYSYELQKKEGDKWVYVTFLNPYGRKITCEHQSEYDEDPELWPEEEDEDEEPRLPPATVFKRFSTHFNQRR